MSRSSPESEEHRTRLQRFACDWCHAPIGKPCTHPSGQTVHDPWMYHRPRQAAAGEAMLSNAQILRATGWTFRGRKRR